ncbi:hypothetical protein K435DRAFT_791168 [Dendrothele bispora CBS 962.96]|uniref:Uncharacterized protein n=1 Tax=Dendrothele bispora (strain CBS 962.96) TaxID=1314807 RepID=A0A4S8MMI2_DENBC|nr:hypothetical protein K435DRAFT_791168 [Dendrothele bispora CBS 962.96]
MPLQLLNAAYALGLVPSNSQLATEEFITGLGCQQLIGSGSITPATLEKFPRLKSSKFCRFPAPLKSFANCNYKNVFWGFNADLMQYENTLHGPALKIFKWGSFGGAITKITNAPKNPQPIYCFVVVEDKVSS